MRTFKVDDKCIGGAHPVYFIAEIGSNFDGEMRRAKELIELAHRCGADAVKFQHYTAQTLVSDLGFRSIGNKVTHQSNWKKSVFNTYDDAKLNVQWTKELKEYSKSVGLSFFTSAYSQELVDLTEPYVPAFKIGSGDISHTKLIKHIACKKKPVFLATGASSISDVERAMGVLRNTTSGICLMQCNTNYENTDQNLNHINLNVLLGYRQKFPNAVLGLSDHTQGHTAALGAVALGAKVIEKHFTDDVNREGPDHSFAMSPDAWISMVKEVRALEKMLGDGLKRIEQNEIDSSKVQRRGICVSRNLQAGHVLCEDDFDYLRPLLEDGFHPFEADSLIGKKLRRQLQQFEMVLKTDVK